jgi:DNA-binding response OmpR family regulator
MGIQFLDPNDEARGRIERFIAEFGMRGARAAETAPRKKSIRVLVVDDDAAYCKLAAEPFRDRGDTVAVAHDGIEALAQCIRERPDVVLCDVQMPKMDGWQLLRMVRARPALAEVPFLFMTTLTSEDDRLLGYRLGVDDYIDKPYRPLEVVARADRAISRAARRRETSAGTPSDKSSLRGDVEQVSLASVLAFLELERKTGVLEVEGLYQARLFVRDGSLLRVEREVLEHGRTTGDREAVFELLDWRRGTFEFQAGKVEGEDRLRSNITSLLLEHARLSDEAARDA